MAPSKLHSGVPLNPPKCVQVEIDGFGEEVEILQKNGEPQREVFRCNACNVLRLYKEARWPKSYLHHRKTKTCKKGVDKIVRAKNAADVARALRECGFAP